MHAYIRASSGCLLWVRLDDWSLHPGWVGALEVLRGGPKRDERLERGVQLLQQWPLGAVPSKELLAGVVELGAPPAVVELRLTHAARAGARERV
eukprot:1984940-Pleurochrysis_carterae.AAC.3